MSRILFFQDNTTALSNQLAVQLEAEGFCVDHAQRENQVWLDNVQQYKPDLILMELPQDNCQQKIQFCQQLRNSGSNEFIPILLVGSKGENGTKSYHHLLEGLNAGANDYLLAPYDFLELIGKINSSLRLKKSMEQAGALTRQLEELNKELYQRNIQVEKELYIARQLQQSLLPSAIKRFEEDDENAPLITKIHYETEKLRVSGIYLPCDALGGDLYDVLKFQDNSLGIAIADVSGHGVPAGFVTAIFKTSLYRVTHQNRDPADVLFHINNELYNIVKTGDYVTAAYLHIDLNTMTVECSGAGHPYPIFYRAQDKQIERLQKNGTPLVWVKDIAYPKDTVQLEPGDKILLFTDGVSELRNPAEEMFGEERINENLLEAIESGSPYPTDNLITYLSDFTEGSPLEDDISIVLIEAL